jgi:hypothetical protein
MNHSKGPQMTSIQTIHHYTNQIPNHHAIESSSCVSNDSLYQSRIIHNKVCIPFSEIVSFNHLREQLMRHISSQMNGRCIAEGFVKPDSCNIRSYSVGIFAGGNITFNLEIECMVCCPAEGTVMRCIAKTVTQAGIRAHACIEPSPVIIYISREMHESSSAQSRTMDSIKPNDTLLIRVIGKRFELNDKHVSIIGEWLSI